MSGVGSRTARGFEGRQSGVPQLSSGMSRISEGVVSDSQSHAPVSRLGFRVWGLGFRVQSQEIEEIERSPGAIPACLHASKP